MIGLSIVIAAQASTPELRTEFEAIDQVILQDARSRDRFAAGEPEPASHSTDSETTPR